MEDYRYNSIGNLLLSSKFSISRGGLTKVDPKIRTDAMGLFLGASVVAIYHESDNKYRGRPEDNYVNCTFAYGPLKDVTPEKIVLGNSVIRTNQVLDMILSQHLEEPIDRKLRVFEFNSIASDTPVDSYELIHFDPARAFYSMRHYGKDSDLNLYLSNISELHQGMMFETIRNR